MEKGMKIFIACAVGGGIGTAVGISFYQNVWFLILGILVGSFTGYFSYEFKEVISVVRIAWNSVVGWRWRPDRAVVKNNIKLSMLIFGCFITVWTLALSTLYHSMYFSGLTVEGLGLFPPLNVIVILVLLAGIITFGISVASFKEEDKTSILKTMIPVYFHLYLLFVLLPKLIWICIKYIGISFYNTPGIVKITTITIVRFVKKVFILIHSEERLLVLTDAGIGVIVGCFMGHIIIGALAGGVIGFLNWEILSKRILKVVPVKST